jgi:endonuclease/exonuclease/phosphatase family metal-dependent hydrolase
MRRMRGRLVLLTLLAAGSVPAATPAPPDAASPAPVRIATFNASLNRATPGALLRDLSTPDDPQARAVAEIIQRVHPDILLLQEFDFDAAGASLAAFQANYLRRSQQGQAPLDFAYTFFTESNTGIPSGHDLDNDGQVAGGGDALGFGEFPGQYAMVLLSRFPIDTKRARTFRRFLWRDMPGALLPDDPATPATADWYSPEELAVLPLSSKNHWDVPVKIGKRTVHLLISHPTPPAFDGPEDRNGRRNHDEILFWRDYITPGANRHIRDDRGRRGGLELDAFLIMGDLNSDPVDGGSVHDAIERLLGHVRIAATPVPHSAGAVEASATQAGVNTTQRSDARYDTADFNDRSAGNLRVDYLLPEKSLTVCGAGVFWPRMQEPASDLVWGSPPPSSDHRLVWLDISPGAAQCPPGSDPTASASSHHLR